MPPVTRSRTRALVNHLKTSPYLVNFFSRLKSKSPQNYAKIEPFLNQEIHPSPENVIAAVAEIAEYYINKYDELKERLNRIRRSQTLADVLYQCLTPLREYINLKTGKSISQYIRSWERNGIDDDTAMEGDILAEFINNGAEKRTKNKSDFQTRFQRYKAWLRMYVEICESIHREFDDMEEDEI